MNEDVCADVAGHLCANVLMILLLDLTASALALLRLILGVTRQCLFSMTFYKVKSVFQHIK